MKNIILIILLLLSFETAYAFKNNTAQLPKITFQSVNTYNMGTRNYTPNITPVGSINTYEVEENYVYGGPRRVIGHPEDPYYTPVGDINMLYILLILGSYIVFKKKENRVC